MSSVPVRAATVRSPHDAPFHDALDSGKGLPGGIGHRFPFVRAGAAVEVVEGQGAGAGWAANHDAANHPGLLMGQAVVVVDSLDGQGHVEVSTWLHEKPRVPWFGALRDPL